MIALTERFHLENSVLLSSFNPINLSKARRQKPEISLGLLAAPGSKAMLGAVGRLFPYDALHPYYEDVTPEMLARLRARGKALNTWTVDDLRCCCSGRRAWTALFVTTLPRHAGFGRKEMVRRAPAFLALSLLFSILPSPAQAKSQPQAEKLLQPYSLVGQLS